MFNYRRLTLALGIASLVLFAGIVLFLIPLSPPISKLQLTFTPGAFKSIYDQWSEVAQHRFSAHFAADYLLIATYSMWGYFHARHSPSMAALRRRTGYLLCLALPLAGVMDIMEDVLHTRIIAGETLVSSVAPYFAAGCAASLKWLIGLGFMLASAIAWRTNRNAA